MEEDKDIKILQNLATRTRPIAEDLETAVCSIDEQVAIRNLIARYKGLEEKEADLTTVYLSGLYDMKKKIKEKIEEKKEQRRQLGYKTYLRREDMLNDDRAIACEIQVLQSLLED